MPDQIDTLRFMYERVADGDGTPKIAQALRQKRVLLPKAVESEKRRRKLAAAMPGGEYRWDSSAIRRLLEREYHHTGTMRVNVAENYPDLLQAYREGRTGSDINRDALTPDGFVEFPMLVGGKPAIDPKVWQAARAQVDRRAKRHGGERRGEGEAFLFGPWLQCECGGNVKARAHRFTNPKKGLTEYRYYGCRFHAADTDREGQPACNMPHLRADDVDARLWEMLVDWISKPSLLLDRWLKRQAAEGPDADALQAEIAGKEAQRAKHERNRAAWLDLFAEASIDKRELTRRSRADAAEIARLTDEIETLRAQRDAALGETSALSTARKLVAEYERDAASVAGKVRVRLNKLSWRRRRALLAKLLGTKPIVLGWRPVASIRGIQKRRAGGGAAGRRAADEFIARWCVLPPKPGQTEGLFVQGVELPANPAKIIEALADAGLDRVFASKGSALA